MVIDSFKICPNCKCKNPSNFIECEECGTDLQMVKISLNDDDIDSKVNEPKVEVKKNSLIKICPICKQENKANAKTCSKCNNDLYLVIATIKQSNVKFVSVDGECEILVNKDYFVIGRANEDYPYLEDKACVSRRHLIVRFFESHLEVKNCEPATPNRPVITYINDKLLGKSEIIELHDGDLIGLGGQNTNKYKDAAYFKVVFEK